MKTLVNSFLFYSVDRYNIRGKNLLKTLGKYYVVDTGLRNHLLSSSNSDIGHQIENIVYLELLRRGYRVNIGKIDKKDNNVLILNSNQMAFKDFQKDMTGESEKAGLYTEQDVVVLINDVMQSM